MSSADAPPAGTQPDVEVDERLVRRLLADLPDDLAHVRELPTQYVAEGWDNSVWRIGTGLAARVPRRPLAASLLLNEGRWAGQVTDPLRVEGVAVPRALHLTPPGRHHPHPWLLVTWVDGAILERTAIEGRGRLLSALVGALPKVHRPTPPDAPLNPFRGPDLCDLPPPPPAIVRAAREHLGSEAVDRLLTVLEHGVLAPPWPGPRLWCHGDLHPRNLLRTPTGGLGVLDLGDVTAGDPAVDLGVLWTTFTQQHRADAIAALTPSYDDHVWDRAQGWAARFVLGVAGHDPHPFRATLQHTQAQLL